MESEEIIFAGLGEPLLRHNVIEEASIMIKTARHGVPLRIETTGLVPSKQASQIAFSLKSAGIDKITIHLMADNPKLYNELMCPVNDCSFSDVCAFIIACAESDLEVACSAVTRPEVNLSRIRSLAQSLGATDFTILSYHP
eukprot:gene3972-5692_t